MSTNNQERKNLGIEGAIKLPDSDFSLIPGSLWNKWKTIIHGEPESDETETCLLVDKNGKLILDEQGQKQTIYRPRSLDNTKDRDHFKSEKIRVFKSYTSFKKNNGQAFDLYVGKDGKIYDPAKDIWMENEVHRGVRELGGVFVNDSFLHLWKKMQGILLLDGSYGSSKTTFAITHLLLICLCSKKGEFNCFYGRQDKEMASQLHANIITEIERNHWEEFFTYSKKDNGSKNIHCVKNDGKFQLFGCNDDATIKGWNNPTHIFIDEINQISFDSFGMLQSRLRRPGVKTLLVGCFNACDVTPIDSDEEGSWLWRYFFNENSGSVEDEMKKKVYKSIGLLKHHSDYLDNYCQNNHMYWFSLLSKAKFDKNVANRFANGDWGTKLNAQLYYNRFDASKHVEDESVIKYHPALKLVSGWDENTQPYQPSLLCQRHSNELWIIDEFLGYNPLNNVSGVAPMIIKKYGGYWDIDGEKGFGLDHRAGMIICGDATSKKEDAKLEKGQNYFTIVQTALKIFKPEVWVQDANPNNKTRGEFVNLIFHNELFGIKIRISSKCVKLIEDLQNVMQDIKNEKKSGHKDKSTKIVNGVRQVQPYGHLGDILDYVICELFMNEYLTYLSGDMTVDAVGGKRGIRNGWEKTADGRLHVEDSEQVKRNKKYRGDTKYGEIDDEVENKVEDDEDFEIVIPKRKSKNSW